MAAELVTPVRSDSSVLVLIAANLVAFGVACATGMSLRDLMLVYWIQSVIIGVTSWIRILRLERFETGGFKIDDQAVEETPATRKRVAAFFAMHYGFFHLMYFIFIAVSGAQGKLGSPGGYAACAAVFALNHAYSLRHNLRRDAQGRPNIGTLMFLPYARILPMHLTILAGGAFFGGAFAFFLFGLLKTLADVVMHVVEHHVLGKPR